MRLDGFNPIEREMSGLGMDISKSSLNLTSSDISLAQQQGHAAVDLYRIWYLFLVFDNFQSWRLNCANLGGKSTTRWLVVIRERRVGEEWKKGTVTRCRQHSCCAWSLSSSWLPSSSWSFARRAKDDALQNFRPPGSLCLLPMRWLLCFNHYRFILGFIHTN